MAYDRDKNPVPKVGEYYHFFDDGKTSPGRHYICRVEKVINVKEAKKTIIDAPYWEKENISLYEVWKIELEYHDYLFDEDNDCFVNISCPTYDEQSLWAVRTKNGGFFTMDIDHFWQGGRIDVTGEIFADVVNDWENWHGDPSEYTNVTYEKR